MIRLETGLEIRHGGVMRVHATEDKTAVLVVASYRSVSRNPVRFKSSLSPPYWYKTDPILYVNHLNKHELFLTRRNSRSPSSKCP